MYGCRSFAGLILAATLPVLAGCATSTSALHEVPRCQELGCTEPINLAAAGPGSTVVMVGCEGAAQVTRRYQRASGQWTLQMYQTRASDACASRSVP